MRTPDAFLTFVVDRRAALAADLRAEADIVGRLQVRKQRIGLEHHGDVALLRRQVVGAHAADQQIAGGDRLQPGQHAQQGRLAAAGRADQHDELAALDVEADVLEDLVLRRRISTGRGTRRRSWSGSQYVVDEGQAAGGQSGVDGHHRAGYARCAIRGKESHRFGHFRGVDDAAERIEPLAACRGCPGSWPGDGPRRRCGSNRGRRHWRAGRCGRAPRRPLWHRR